MQLRLGKKRNSLTPLLSMAGFLVPTLSVACPDLQRFYDGPESQPAALVEAFEGLLDQCYSNSEYFALNGAAYLRMGDLLRALENLERALLLDPNNGSAAVDFAEVLYRQGQVNNAIEVNAQLLSRNDLPEDLRDAISSRQRRWRRDRNQGSLSLGTAVGYDNNLNSAPIADQLALTLSGNPVLFDVSPDFQAAGATYARLTGAGALLSVGQSVNSSLTASITGRFSEDSDYDLIQGSARYRLVDSSDRPAWNATFGLDHLVWGGNTVFSSATIRAGYLLRDFGACRVYPRLAMQYQKYEAQELLSGYEYFLGLGSECDVAIGGALNRFGLEFGALRNQSRHSGRLGGDRQGWQTNFFWQRTLGAGQVMGQYQFTKFNDEEGYSPLFKNGARRRENLHSVYFSYALPLKSFGGSAQFVSTAAYHNQTSSIALFRTRGASAEFGVVWGF